MNSIAPMSTPRVGWPTSRTFGLARHLARQHQLLLVAAGEVRRAQAGQRAAARRSAPSAWRNVAPTAPCVHQVAAAERRHARDSRASTVLGRRERRHHALAQAVLRHMREAEIAHLGRVAGMRRASIVAAAAPSSVPLVGGRMPDSTSSSSLWPLPETPAMPTISPARSSRSTSSSRRDAARVDAGRDARPASRTSPGCGARLVELAAAPCGRPSARPAPRGSVLGGAALGHHSPWRMTIDRGRSPP